MQLLLLERETELRAANSCFLRVIIHEFKNTVSALPVLVSALINKFVLWFRSSGLGARVRAASLLTPPSSRSDGEYRHSSCYYLAFLSRLHD